MSTYVDGNGYKRHSNLVHREKAYEQIYKKNRDKYPLPFSEYVVHHKDGDKQNNDIQNLEILTPAEHEKVHGISEFSSSIYMGGSSNYHLYDEPHSFIFNLFVFHVLAFIVFCIIIPFLFFEFHHTSGINFFTYFFGFFSSDFWLILIALVIAYFFLASWWIEGIRQNFI